MKALRNPRVVSSAIVPFESTRLERDVGFPAHDKGTQGSKNLSQVQLRHGRSERTGRCPGNGRRLSAPRVLTIGSGTPVDRVLEHGGKGAIVLRPDEQHRIGGGYLRL